MAFSQINFFKWDIKIQFCLVLERNRTEYLIFKVDHKSLKDFKFLFGAIKSSSLYWAKNPHVKISVTQVVLVIQEAFFPFSLKNFYKVAHLLLKRTKSWITSVHLGKKKNEKFHNVNRNEIFTPFIYSTKIEYFKNLRCCKILKIQKHEWSNFHLG